MSLVQVLTKKARCFVNLVIWHIITAIRASKQTMIMLESRMPGQLACPVWRGLGRNASQQWDYRAPLPPYITYIPLAHGFMYLIAIIDWFSRYVLAWQLSNTLDGLFCIQALKQALQRGQPEIFNTDQGAQFTALAFTGILEAAPIRISMDGRGRALDNIFVERLWRSLKYEDIYFRIMPMCQPYSPA